MFAVIMYCTLTYTPWYVSNSSSPAFALRMNSNGISVTPLANLPPGHTSNSFEMIWTGFRDE